MYRYFLTHTDHLPKRGEVYGAWHAIDLASHGKAGAGWHALVMHDRQFAPHPEWRPFPKAIDSKTPIRARLDHALLADLGLTGAETTLEASEILAGHFAPFTHP